MTQSKDYRMYLEEKFEGMTKHMNAEFININDTLDRIENHVNESNGRVHDLEDWRAAMIGQGASVEEYKKKRLGNFQIFGIVMATLIGLVTAFGIVFKKDNKSEDRLDKLELRMLFKEDKNPILKSITNPIEHYQDSVDIRWAEKKYDVKIFDTL